MSDTFETQFIENLSNAEVELKESVAYKKNVYSQTAAYINRN